MKFTIAEKWGHARNGSLELPHGKVDTPVFMPVGTKASVKSLTPDDLEDLGSQIILGNTYHLYLRPGDELIHSLGGLHKFANWTRPMLTDSGGFQVSSLGHFRKLDKKASKIKASIVEEDGVTFYSHLDGDKHYLDAEKSIQIQTNLGADIIMAFDEATPDKGEVYAQSAMERTHHWLLRSIEAWKKLEKTKHSDIPPQYLFGIIQGGNYPHLRQESAEFVLNQDLPGVAVGGGSIGADRLTTSENVSWIRPQLPKDKPLYLMGVGVNPEDLISAILDGADMFDCVAPTRLARTGILYDGMITTEQADFGRSKHVVEFDTKPKLFYTSEFERGRIQISNQIYIQDSQPISRNCQCYTCRKNFSRAYLRHLFASKELLYYRLASIHNLYHMIDVVKQMRRLIQKYAA